MPNGSGVPSAMRRRVMREENHTCGICGIKGFERRFPKGGFGHYTDVPGIFMSVDHIVAKSKGGSNDRSNLRCLCTKCNTAKGVKDA